MQQILNIAPQIKKNQRGYKIDLYVCAPFACYMTRDEIFSYKRRGYIINVTFLNHIKKNADKRDISENDILLRLLKSFESYGEQYTIKFLNKIIRKGGFISYIEQMEAALKDEENLVILNNMAIKMQNSIPKEDFYHA